MRIAVISDIHGNAHALRPVLADMANKGIDHLLIAGDFVGYYYRPDEVFALLKGWRWECIQGNHDAMLARFFQEDAQFKQKYRQHYGGGLDIASRVLTKTQTDFLKRLPEKRECIYGAHRLLLCHGSPWQQDEYIYPDAPDAVFERIAELEYDTVIMGHTHYPMIRKVGKTLIVNPGSVGQPRDYGSSASWVLLDIGRGEALIQRVPFDPTPVIEDAQRYSPENAYLVNVLTRKQSQYAQKI